MENGSEPEIGVLMGRILCVGSGELVGGMAVGLGVAVGKTRVGVADGAGLVSRAVVGDCVGILVGKAVGVLGLAQAASKINIRFSNAATNFTLNLISQLPHFAILKSAFDCKPRRKFKQCLPPNFSTGRG